MSATMTQSQQRAAVAFKMPKPDIGLLVHWFPAGDRSGHCGRPCPAIPVLIGESSIDVMLVQEDLKTLVRMDGVRHIDDPAAVQSEFEDFGSWDFLPDTKLLHEYAVRFSEANERILALEKKVVSKAPTKQDGAKAE
jgi:hypothetical protein